jgi:hypothetical protein
VFGEWLCDMQVLKSKVAQITPTVVRYPLSGKSICDEHSTHYVDH